MTKAELVEKIAAEIKISKAAAAKALAVVTGSITQAMKKGDKVTLVGFGTFSVASLRPGRKKPPDRKRDQDSRELGSQVLRGSNAEGCGQRQGDRETGQEETGGQNEKEIDHVERAFGPASPPLCPWRFPSGAYPRPETLRCKHC